MAEEVGMNSQHTPGPWECHAEEDETGYPVFCLHGFCGDQKRDLQTLEANARLIAAAPNLLAALRGCADRMAIAASRGEKLAIDEPALIDAVEAIAKAEGRS